MPYRPPEACQTYDEDIPLDGKMFEIWSYGMLAFNIFTGHILKKQVLPDTKSWHRDIFPSMYEAMQIYTFYSLMSKAFPPAVLTEEEISNALNFLYFLLRFEPGDRPSITNCAQHIFLAGGEYVIDKPDENWIFLDLSDCKCPCQNKASPTSNKVIKKISARFKFRKVSPRRGRRRYKQMKKWTKRAGNIKTEKPNVIPESGDTGNQIVFSKTPEDYRNGTQKSEIKKLTSGNYEKVDEISNGNDNQISFKMPAEMNSESFEWFSQSEGKIVGMEFEKINKIGKNEHRININRDHLPDENLFSWAVFTSDLSTFKGNQRGMTENAELVTTEKKQSSAALVNKSVELMSAGEKQSAIFGDVELMESEERQSATFESIELLSTEENQSTICKHSELLSIEEKQSIESESADLLNIKGNQSSSHRNIELKSNEGEQSALSEKAGLMSISAKKNCKYSSAHRKKRRNNCISRVRYFCGSLFKCFGNTKKI